MSDEKHLSPAKRYRRDGFVFPLDILDSAQAKHYREKLEVIESRYPEGSLPRPLNQYLRVNAQYVLPLAAELALYTPILDIIESILGTDILVWSCEFFIKEPGTQKVVSWHQDLTYWGMGETDEEVTAWLALSPSTLESGCMRFVPGSHLQTLQPHQDTFDDENLLSRGQEIAVAVDENDALPVLLAPGQMSLHHGRMFHASGPNSATDRRIGVAIRYVSPTVTPQFNTHDYALLARGNAKTRHWVTLAAPELAFSPTALDDYERILKQQSNALTQGAEQQVGLYY